MDVSNTALILAVRLLNVNQLLCPEWVSDTAPLSAQYVNENHVLSNANQEWVTARTWFTSSAGHSVNELSKANHVREREWRREGDSRPQQVVQWTNWVTCWGRESRSCQHSRSRTWFASAAGRSMNELLTNDSHRWESHLRTWETFTVQLNHLTWCYMDVSNTALILAVRLLNVNQLLCPEWQFHSRPACSQLSSTELRKEQISSWSDSAQFVHSKNLFVRTTHLWPTQH